MVRSGSSGINRRIPWLPDEQFEMALDAHRGILTHPAEIEEGHDVLTVTTHRAIRVDRESGRKTTRVVPLDRITAVETTDVGRAGTRLAQGLMLLGVGLILGFMTRWLLEVDLLALLAGGVPALLGIYLLAGYAFPDDQGELVLHAQGYHLHLPLLSAAAREDSSLVAHRLVELMGSASEHGQRAAPAPVPEPPQPPVSEESVPLRVADVHPAADEPEAAPPPEYAPSQEGPAAEAAPEETPPPTRTPRRRAASPASRKEEAEPQG